MLPLSLVKDITSLSSASNVAIAIYTLFVLQVIDLSTICNQPLTVTNQMFCFMYYLHDVWARNRHVLLIRVFLLILTLMSF